MFENAAFRKLPFMSRVEKREFQCGLQVRVLKPSLCTAKKLKQKFCIVLSNFAPEEFVYIWQGKRVGIVAIKMKERRFTSFKRRFHRNCRSRLRSRPRRRSIFSDSLLWKQTCPNVSGVCFKCCTATRKNGYTTGWKFKLLCSSYSITHVFIIKTNGPYIYISANI